MTAESPAAALQEAREARDGFFDAHVVGSGAARRRRRHPGRGSAEGELAGAAEGALLVAACRELADTARMLR